MHHRLVLNESCLVLQPSLVAHLGRSTAVILQQIHYWVSSNNYGKVIDGKRWIYNSYDAFADNIKIFSVSTIRRAIKKLEHLGLIQSRSLNVHKGDRTKWYTLNHALIAFFEKESEVKMNRPSVQNDVIIIETENTFKNKYMLEEKREGEGVFKKDKPQEKMKETKEEESAQQASTDMLAIWMEHFPKSKTVMTKRLGASLDKTFQGPMNGDLQQWKKYCRMIASSSYLTSDNFKLTLFWALQHKTIARIFAYDLGVKDVSDVMPENLEDKATAHIATVLEEERCRHYRRSILKNYGAGVYLSWFQNLHLFMDGTKICLRAPNCFHADYVTERFLRVL